jgi:hypothetical protein
MTEQETLVKAAGWLAVHVAAIVGGVILMFVGVGMGVTVVMLPAGIPVGFAGLFLFLWGLFVKPEAQGTAPK